MDDVSRNKERRRQVQLERLGSNAPYCVICGEDDPACLELHHIAGRKYDDELVCVCRNCHRKLSDPQKDHPRARANPPSFEECLAHFLHGVADLFEILVKRFRALANELFTNITESQSKKEHRDE